MTHLQPTYQSASSRRTYVEVVRLSRSTRFLIVSSSSEARSIMQCLNARLSLAAPRRAAARPQRCGAFRALTSATARVDKCDKKSIIVSPSILSANFAKLGEQARRPLHP